MAETTALRFDGSVWCNLDIALRNIDQIFRQAVRPHQLTVIEWYILRALYEKDGQHASALAQAVGRAATSFTPNLDKLQNKGLIERRPDPSDRRAVLIHLTEKGADLRDDILELAEELDGHIAQAFSANDFKTFLEILAALQLFAVENQV